jgi:hypothetical protein
MKAHSGEPPKEAGVGTSRREHRLRPPDLMDALDERPPLARLILLGAQHVAVVSSVLEDVFIIGCSSQTLTDLRKQNRGSTSR